MRRSDRERAWVYGLRAKDSNRYIYVGSTKVSAKRRLDCHLGYAKSHRTLNKHLERKILKIGADNVASDVLAEVPIAERFTHEYQWIAKLRSEGHSLCNILLSEPQYQSEPKTKSIEDDYAEKMRDPYYVLRALESVEHGPGTSIDPRNQDLVVAFYRIAVKSLKRIGNAHWEELIAAFEPKPSCEIINLIATKIKRLPSLS